MTTGNVLQDGQYLDTTWNGPKKFGTYHWRSWGGSDASQDVPIGRRYVRYKDPLTGRWKKRYSAEYIRARKQPHPYTCELIEYYAAPFQFVQFDQNVGYVHSFSDVTVNGSLWMNAWTWGPALWDANAEIALIAKLREAINGSEFNPSIMLGELNQTLEMITDRSKKIAKMLAAVRRKDVAGALRAIGHSSSRRKHLTWTDASSLLLEIKFGWQPLLMDVYEGAQYLAHQLNAPKGKVFRVKGRKSATYEDGPGTTVCCYPTRRYTAQRQIVAMLEENIPENFAAKMSLLHPEEVAWEKLGFSFVADWFIPIGDYLSARGIASALSGQFVLSLKHLWEQYGIHSNQFNTGFYAPSSFTGGDGSFHTHMLFNREVVTSLDVPLPVFKGFGKAASWWHCAEAVSLVTQFGSKKQNWNRVD